MQARPRHALLAAAVLAVTGTSALAPSADAASAAPQTTTVEAQPGGGYITTYADVNGDVTKVYAAMPVTVSLDAPTSQQITVDGTAVTEHTGGVSVTPTGTFDKSTIVQDAAASTLLGSPVSPYEELLAMGADPADVASFRDVDNNSGTSTALGAATQNSTTPALSNRGGGTQIGPPICLGRSFDGGHGHMYGCDVTRRVGTSGYVWYLTDATQSSGSMHDTTHCVFCDHLTGLKFGTKYGSGNTIQTWKPRATNNVGSCVQNTVSLSYKGVGVSSTSQQCPATFGLYGIGKTYYSTKWNGKGHGPSHGTRATHQVDGVYNGATASPYPGVYTTWWYTTS